MLVKILIFILSFFQFSIAIGDTVVPSIEKVSVKDKGFILEEDMEFLDGNEKKNINITNNINKSKISDNILISTGDLTVEVDKNAFDRMQDKIGKLTLLINGIPLPNDANFIGGQAIGNKLELRYRIKSGEETKKLWSTVFLDGGLYHPKTLSPSLQWDEQSSHKISLSEVKATSFITITTRSQLILSVFFLIFSVTLIIYLAWKTDILRDAPDICIPDWWTRAKRIQLKRISLKGINQDEFLSSQFGVSYQKDQIAIYNKLALDALAGDLVKSDEDVIGTIIGLACLEENWKPLRASYSLGRTQMAIWFAFSIGVGIFLWIIYADLPTINSSLLILLGISGSTTAINLLSDNDSGKKKYLPSKGFWTDITTGWDDQTKIYRYQSILINFLLLLVGIYYVVEQLDYPVFDETWLIFLGVSGATYTVGKRLSP